MRFIRINIIKVILTILLITNHQSLITLNAQVGINDNNASPDASAMLDVKSTTKGMLIPRMTTTERNVISSPATGLMIYNTTTNQFNFHNGTVWVAITAGAIQELADADNDTKIQVEKSADEDSIRFNIMGTERLVMKRNGGNFTMMSLPNNRRNIFIGEKAGFNNASANAHEAANNIFLGTLAGYSNTTGFNNLFYGKSAGYSNTTGAFNMYIGADAGYSSTTAAFNTYIGNNAGYATTTGGNNLFIGTSAGASTTTGQENVYLGSSTFPQNQTGSNNTIVGYTAGVQNMTGSGNVFMGHSAGFNETGSNKLYIDNSNTSSPLLYGEFDNNLLRVNGTLNVNNAFSFPTADGTSGQILTTNGSGTLTWTTPTANTDNQTTDVFQLNGNNLELSLSNDGVATKSVDLSGLKDNLGDHTATANVQIGSHYISNDGTNKGISINNKGEITVTANNSSFRPAIFTSAHNDLTYIEVKNSVGTRAIWGTDGAWNSSPNTDVVLGNWSNGGINFYTNATKRIYLSNTGLFTITGSLKVVDGTQGAGKVLVSDANGQATWTDPSEISNAHDTTQPTAIKYRGYLLYVHPSDNAADVNWATAKSTCENLTAFGKSDWYLPSRTELNAMYKQSYLVAGLTETEIIKYWSSTAKDATYAFTQRLDYGGPDPDDKTDTSGHNCRCVRKN
jgi:hypothetical protein